jgi:hypothetical protein
MRQEEGFKFCLDTRNNRALTLDLACPKRLSVQSSIDLQVSAFYFTGKISPPSET